MSNFVSACAAQAGRDDSEKEDIYNTLEDTMLSLHDQEYTFLLGDLNGHIGGWRHCFDCEIGPFCFCTQNWDGQRLINFCHTQKLTVLDTFSQNCFEDDNCMFKSGGNSIHVFILTRSSQRSCVKNLKVIKGDYRVAQHRIVVCDFYLKV